VVVVVVVVWTGAAWTGDCDVGAGVVGGGVLGGVVSARVLVGATWRTVAAGVSEEETRLLSRSSVVRAAAGTASGGIEGPGVAALLRVQQLDTGRICARDHPRVRRRVARHQPTTADLRRRTCMRVSVGGDTVPRA
jgi:hypothetical protein